MSLRQILNVVYAMHVENMDADARNEFNAQLAGETVRDARSSRARSLGAALVVPSS